MSKDRVTQLEERVARLERTLFPLDYDRPPSPAFPASLATACPKCRIRFDGATGYVCPDLGCPMQVRGASIAGDQP